MSTVALVPARGGSVRVPRKNLEHVGGRSLVARAIRCATAVRRIRAVYVSTDDAEIAEEVRSTTAIVIERPAALAESATRMEDVVSHFIKEANVPDSSVIVLLEPSAPFRRPADIEQALAYLDGRPDAAGVRTLSRLQNPPYYLHTVGGRGFIEPLVPVAYRSLHRPVLFRDNGLVNAFRVSKFLDAGELLTDAVLGMEIIPSERGIDIDTPEDLALARLYADEFDRD